MDHVFDIDEAGTITGLWTEMIELRPLGSLNITRASEIEFDNGRGLWQVKINGAIVFEHASRDHCLQWEKEFFNQELLAR